MRGGSFVFVGGRDWLVRWVEVGLIPPLDDLVLVVVLEVHLDSCLDGRSMMGFRCPCRCLPC